MSNSGALKRLWKNFPLHRLQQGSTLTIRSRIPLLNVHIESGWRDNGKAQLEQVVVANKEQEQKQQLIDWKIDQTEEQETSIGRSLPHLVMDIFHVEEDENDSKETATANGDEDDPLASLSVSTPTKETDKVILDDGSIVPIETVPKIPPVDSQERVDYHDGVAHVLDPQKGDTVTPKSGNYITIHTPESVNINVRLMAGNITVKNKVEGDVHLHTDNGHITVDKIRGHAVTLRAQSPGNIIRAKTLLEGRDVSIETPGRFRAKQCHGSNLHIHRPSSSSSHGNHVTTITDLISDDQSDNGDEGSLVDISSLYISGSATIRVAYTHLRRRAVRITSHHGAVSVDTLHDNDTTMMVLPDIHPPTQQPYPVVEMGGVNGCCEVSCRSSPITTQEDTTSTTIGKYVSCRVHVDSLLPNHINLVTADHGSIGITIDRKVETDLRLASLPNTAGSLQAAAATVAEEEDSNLLVQVLDKLVPTESSTSTVPAPKDPDTTISVSTNSFHETKSHQTTHIVYREGSVDNASAEPDSRFDRKGAGKVNVDAAAAQAFGSFSSSEDEQERPLLAVVGVQRIVVETVSWIGAIARRYGLDETSDRELGRTASRRGRSWVDPQ